MVKFLSKGSFSLYMKLIKSVLDYFSKPKATADDLYGILDRKEWKYGLELIKDLEEKGFRAGHIRGRMYVHLSEWQRQGLVDRRYGAHVAGPESLRRPQYRKTSGGKRVREEPLGGLEVGLGFA